MVSVEVVYALPDEQAIISVSLPEGSTIQMAINASGILERFPGIDLTQQSVGIFGQIASLETVLSPHDRVEIYRPLIVDPMEARRLRAKKQQLAPQPRSDQNK